MNRRSVTLFSRLLTVLALLAAVAANPFAVGESQAQAPSNVIYVGTSLTLAPFSFINEKGENVGFEIDVLKAIGERLGYQFQFVRVPFSQNFTSLNAGIFRVSASSAFMTC